MNKAEVIAFDCETLETLEAMGPLAHPIQEKCRKSAIAAQKARLKGDIAAAQMHETTLEALYKRLAPRLRW